VEVLLRLTRIEICDGAALTCVTTDRFKTNVLTAFFIHPLKEDSAADNALIPRVLRRGNKKHPTLTAMSNRLADLFGTELNGDVRKRGEFHCFGLSADFIGSENLGDVSEILFDTLYNPVFSDDFILSERDNLISQIRALKNNKALYVSARHNALAFAGEPYAVTRLGDEISANMITPSNLRRYYQKILDSSPIELFYCGPADSESIASLAKAAISRTQSSIRPAAQCKTPSSNAFLINDNPRYFAESEDISQAQLSVIWRTDITPESPDYFPAAIACAMYGGSSASKLFSHVRERLSLCYTTHSAFDRYKGLMKAQSGVEPAMLDRTKDEMLTQWDDIVSGKFSDEEFNSAVSLITNELKSVNDSPAALESFWQGQAVCGLLNTPTNWIETLRNIEKEDVIRTASNFMLDSIYYLKPGVSADDEGTKERN
jgi:predicted Zn-dependent peptidase